MEGKDGKGRDEGRGIKGVMFLSFALKPSIVKNVVFNFA